MLIAQGGVNECQVFCRASAMSPGDAEGDVVDIRNAVVCLESCEAIDLEPEVLERYQGAT